jgi:hypothetical protein
MSAPEQAFAAGVLAALSADAGVRAVLGNPARVFGEEPDVPVFPYATLGESQTTPRDSSTKEAHEHALTVHVWSRHGGRAEAHEVAAAIRAALHDRSIAIETRRLVFLFVVFVDAFRAPDLKTTHAVVRLKALTEPQ